MKKLSSLPEEQPVVASQYRMPMINDASYVPLMSQRQKGILEAAYATPSPTPARTSRVSYLVTPDKSREHSRHSTGSDLVRGFQGPPITNDEECRPNPFTPKKIQSENLAQVLTPSEPRRPVASAYLTPSPTPVRASRVSYPITPVKSEKHTRYSMGFDLVKGFQGPPITNDKECRPNLFTLKKSQVENPAQLLTPPGSSAPRIKTEHKPVDIKCGHQSVLLTPPVTPLKTKGSANIFVSSATKEKPKPLSITLIKKEESFSTFVETTPVNESPTSVSKKETRTYLTLDGKFSTGERLLPYQLNDMFLLVNRELGEKVCRTNSWNNIGYLLAYDMGLGKTVVSLALSILNPPDDEFEGARATLVIVPNKGMMNQWKSEIQKFAPQLDVCMYDSINAELRPNADIVLLTHTQLRNQHRTKLSNPKSFAKCLLYQNCWYRIIIDEAHYSRNPATKLAEAIWNVNKRHGLCLTGTPVQNSIVDLYPLFRFLGVEYENIHVLTTFETKVYARRQKGRICDPRAQEILDTVKKSFCIFRSKIDSETGEVLVDLPPRKDMDFLLSFTPAERMIYQFVKRHPLQILAKLTRLRQACDHPVLLAQGLKDDLVYAEEGENYDFMAGSLIPGTTNKLPKNVRMVFERGDRYQSSKLRAMLKILKKHEGQKTIVFTHFTSMIQSIGNALDRAGIIWTEYTGGMTPKQQEEALKELAEDDQYTVIIISIMAGSTGLNITSCNNVILLEPWWNPFAEEQAISRVHRIGQTLPVNVYRLITEDSLEESILATQSMKHDMAGDIYGFEVDSKTQEAWLAGP